MPAAPTGRYVDQVERPPLSVRLDATSAASAAHRTRGSSTRCSATRVRSCSALVGTSGERRPATDYRDPTCVAVFLALGSRVPFFFRRRRAARRARLISERRVVILTVARLPDRRDAARARSSARTPSARTAAARDRVDRRRSRSRSADRRRGRRHPRARRRDIVAQLRVLRRRVPVRLDDAQPAALHASSSRSAPRRSSASATRRRKRAVADERLRIAQELHDVVAHSMGVIAVQAGVGAHVIDTDPAEAKKSLEAISTTSRVDADRDPPHARRAARRRRRRRTRRRPGSPTSTGSSRDVGGAGLDGRRARRGRRATSCRPASTSPPTASCRRR